VYHSDSSVISSFMRVLIADITELDKPLYCGCRWKKSTIIIDANALASIIMVEDYIFQFQECLRFGN